MMADNIFDQLRGKIDDLQLEGRLPAQEKNGLGHEAELRTQLQRIQFFRGHVFPIVRDFLRTVIALQRDKIRSAHMDQMIAIEYPLAGQPETRYGFRIPLQTSRSPQVQLEQAMLTATIPNKPSRLYLWAFRIKAIESKIEADISVYDELARRTHNLEGFEAEIDSHSEFKEGEMLITVKTLVDRAIERCVKDMA
jgi:hypothetical protein